MVRVATFGNFAVYVYAESNQPHHLPHCNVRWPDGDAQLALPSLDLIVGDAVPKRIVDEIREMLDEVCDEWDQLNPVLAVSREAKS